MHSTHKQSSINQLFGCFPVHRSQFTTVQWYDAGIFEHLQTDRLSHFNGKKTEWAPQLIVFLGILLNDQSLTLAVPVEKCHKAVNLLTQAKNR